VTGVVIGDPKPPATKYRGEAHEETYGRARNGCRTGWPVEQVSSHNDGGAREGGDGLEISPKHHRDFLDNYIANHAAANCRQNPEQRGSDRIDVVGERLLPASHGKCRETRGIEQQHDTLHTCDARIPEKRRNGER
jgi:hypothetical protein